MTPCNAGVVVVVNAQMIDCLICHESVKIPVRFRCFSCCGGSDKETDCYSIVRVCMHCADGYLELHTVQSKRARTRKCLLCDAVAHPRNIRAATEAYEKDFLIMSLDPRPHACPRGCSFVGIQCDLNRHMNEKCPLRMIQCPLQGCGWYQWGEEAAHRYDCVAYTPCTMCTSAVPKDEFEEHLKTNHQIVKCRYCTNMFKEDNVAQHGEICIHRPIDCPVCESRMQICIMDAHLMNHIRTLRNRMHKEEDELIKFRGVSPPILQKIDTLSHNITQLYLHIHRLRLVVRCNTAGLKIA